MTTTLDHRPALTLKPLQTHDASPSPTTRPHATGTARLTGWERNGDRRDRVHLALSELLRTRRDLEGVSLVADVMAEDLLWSA